ncbi:hypothetical protein GE09DRAFT_706742 [Coniochaeta sp. 2T2.1]|nr:hypothetical protein GE09DRAFT_706742 [Coniochaeta sp. 2T2.1]
MASTSFITEAGQVPGSSSATAGTSSSTVTSLARSNSNPNSNSTSSIHPKSRLRPSDNSTFSTSTIKVTSTTINNLQVRSNSLRRPNNKTADDNASSPRGSGTTTNSNETNSILHVHRQNHNSSKLPAFRFADLKKDALVRPNLLQHRIPPSPVSPIRDGAETVDADKIQTEVQRQQDPDPQRDLHDAPLQTSPQQNKPLQRTRHIPASPPDHKKHEKSSASSGSPPEREHASHLSPSRIRASTFQTALSHTDPLTPASSAKRPASFPDSPSAVASLSKATPADKSQHRGAPTLSSPESNGTPAGNGPPLTQPGRAASDSATKNWAQGQRELLLPKAVESNKSDDKRRSRPPVSFRQPNITASGHAVVAPIRGFRSSGSRKSLVLDMNTRRMSYDGSSDGSSDPNHRDRTLRALEGRTDDGYSQMTPPDSAEATPDDNTADIFMRIAREDSTQRSPRDNRGGDEQSAIARVARTTQRRPFSAAVPSHQVSSPPQVVRRLSDQRETSRTRRANEQSAQQMTRELNYRGIARDQPKPSWTGSNDEPARTQSSRAGSLRPSPITPRTLAFHDSQSEAGSGYSRRRPSITESSGGLPSRASQLRNPNLAYAQGRTYNSSPLAPRTVDASSHHPADTNHGLEGTESSASTAAPSMIWDELDDMKSRIRRLELTGKPPATSAAAMSRISDERPATAVTNATSMSASPKRNAGTNAPQTEVGSTTSSQRDSQPIVLSALSKTKGIVSSDVYSAIESAVNDALALMSMMGAPGLPGPISSGASTIGGGGGGSVTDRQLRRKAESICRNLTELCLALTEDAPEKPTEITVSSPPEQETVVSPTTSRMNNVSSQRRPSALTDQTLSRLNATPRGPSSLDQRRTYLSTTPLPSPRFAALPGSQTDGVGRKSSLLVSRRRAGTEEPEEQTGRKSSLLLRTRRAGTEEPDEGRKTSLLLRTRRGTNDDEEDEARFRAPSRAVTEVNGLRPLHRNYAAHDQDANGQASSALPRRRLLPSSLNSRLAGPSSPAVPSPATSRRFLDRSTPERDTNSVAEKLAEERGQRQFSLSQTAMLNRTSSVSRRRDSHIPSLSSPSTQQAGAYR